MELKKLFDFEIVQTEDIVLPDTCAGELLISPTSGGTFEGATLRGELVPIGLGTTYTRGEHNDIQSNILLRTDDGCDIFMQMQAFFDVSPEVEERLMRGESRQEDEYYYKGTITFQTGAQKYRWLQRRVCVCECVINDWTNLRISVYMLC